MSINLRQPNDRTSRSISYPEVRSETEKKEEIIMRRQVFLSLATTVFFSSFRLYFGSMKTLSSLISRANSLTMGPSEVIRPASILPQPRVPDTSPLSCLFRNSPPCFRVRHVRMHHRGARHANVCSVPPLPTPNFRLHASSCL